MAQELNPHASSFTPSFGSSSTSQVSRPLAAAAAEAAVEVVDGGNGDNNDVQRSNDDGKKRKRKDKNKHKIQDPKEVLKLKLVHHVGMACKHNKPKDGLEAYREAKNQNVIIKPEVFNMLITLLSGLSNHIKVSDNNEEDVNSSTLTTYSDEGMYHFYIFYFLLLLAYVFSMCVCYCI